MPKLQAIFNRLIINKNKTKEKLMFNRKKELLSYLEQITAEYEKAVEVVPELLADTKQDFIFSKNTVFEAVSAGELLIPVVGGFSAGKSTALNNILGSDTILPVAVTAETAIPAELRYSTDEYINALTITGVCERHAISDLPDLSINAKNYEVVQVYLNRETLKAIEPFTLVDMPGFDAPIEQHNNAILRYLSRGSYYIYMLNTKDGNLNRQDLRRLDDIVNMGRNFSIFLTKKDLCTETELAGVHQYVADQVQTAYGNFFKIHSIDHHNTDLITQELKDIDPN
ncbi:MAG: dynamin family protein [Thiolinea sp.]